MSKKWVRTDSPAALYLTFCLNDQSLIRSEELHNAPPPSVACCYAMLRTCAVVQDTSEPWNWYTVINYPLHPPPPLLISITPQRDPWEPVVLPTPCSSARLFHSKHLALTRQTWHGGLIMPQGEWPARAACLPITLMATSQDFQIRSSLFTWERWSQIAALGLSLPSDVSVLLQRHKRKKKVCRRSQERRQLCWRQWCKKLQYITVSVEVWLHCLSVRGEGDNLWSVCLGCGAQFWHVYFAFIRKQFKTEKRRQGFVWVRESHLQGVGTQPPLEGGNKVVVGWKDEFRKE